MTGDHLWREFNAARAAMTPPDRALLQGRGIRAGDILFLTGVARVRLDGGLYEPAEDGGLAYLTPVLIEHPETPESPSPAQAIRFGELVDIVAWHPRHPAKFVLRVGFGEWLGAVEPQCLDPAPVSVHRGVLSWLQSGCRGIVPLSPSPWDRYRLLSGFPGGLVAEDAAHAAELRAVLAHPWPAAPVLVARQREARHAA